MLRIALIGCGGHSRSNHAASLARYRDEHPGEIELVAACDLDSDRAQEVSAEHGFARAYTDLDEMLDAESPDACVCVMPIPSIASVGVRLLERGMPSTVEKPLGATLEEARRLAEVAARTDTPHMVSVDRRFSPFMVAGLEWCRRQGPIRYVLASMIRPARREPRFLVGTGVHAMDAMRHIAGEVTRFSDVTQAEPGLTSRWFHVDIEFESGALGRLDIVPTAGVREERYEICGEGFMASVSTPFLEPGSVKCWRDGKLVVDEGTAPGAPHYITCGAYGETVEFIGALREGRRPGPEVAEVLPSLEICYEVLGRSEAEGSTV